MVFTVMRLLPPPPSICAVAGVTSNEHGRAAWTIGARWLFTDTLPERETIWGFASTLAVKVASPWPEALLNRIHDASLLDVHEQSRVVATVIVTLPPSAETDWGLAVTVVAQRMSDGPVT